LQDHENDCDDIVPELNDPVKVQLKMEKKTPKLKDFQGEEYNEVFDD